MLPLTHILLDAARMGIKMEEAMQLESAYDSLYRGRSEENLAAVAPYIFRFASGSPFGEWYTENGWGDSWGILLKSSWPMHELHKHFRKFLLVKTEEGKELYFRFYDPRVLRIFLPTCDETQIREFFGPVDYFIVEDEDPAYALKFWHENAVLKTQRLGKEVLISGNVKEAPVSFTATTTEQNAPGGNAPAKPKSKWDLFD
jgi:hypothetical protein